MIDIRVHKFDGTTEAYDATQCNEDIRDGDVLVIKPERVVGFLVEAWPSAVTVAHGELHGKIEGDIRTFRDGKYVASDERARQIARDLGYPLA